MSNVLNKILSVFLIIVIILVSVYAILRITNIIELYKVETGSMEDDIHPGDYILISKQNDYEVGDIVTFKVKGYHITHRIIKTVDGNVITKGDANNVEDEPISKKDILGKVILSGGILNYIISYKYAIIGLLIILYLITWYLDIPDTDVEKKDDKIDKRINKNNSKIEDNSKKIKNNKSNSKSIKTKNINTSKKEKTNIKPKTTTKKVEKNIKKTKSTSSKTTKQKNTTSNNKGSSSKKKTK